jgi:hypothetical protein
MIVGPPVQSSGLVNPLRSNKRPTLFRSVEEFTVHPGFLRQAAIAPPPAQLQPANWWPFAQNGDLYSSESRLGN